MSQRGGAHSIRSSSPAGSVATSGGSGGEKDIRRQKTRMVDEITEEFKKMGLEIGNPILEKQSEPGQYGRPLKLSTNVYGIRMDQLPVFRYDITISATFKGGRDRRPVEFTKRSKEDVVVVDRKNMCRVVFQEITSKYADEIFGPNKHALYYDLQSILYTLAALELGPKKEMVLELDEADCTNVQQLQRFARVEMLVRKVRDGFELTLGDMTHLNNDTTQQNHSLQQFIELATSQCPLFDPQEHVIISGGTSFLMNPQNYGFTANDGPDLSESKYLAIGSHKSVRYVEGPKGRNNKHAGLIVETKKTPFHHCDQSLMDKAFGILQRNIGADGSTRSNDVFKLHHQFKTLHVVVRYKDGRSRDLRVTGVSDKTARSTQIDERGKTVEDYFLERYDMELRYPNAPMVSALQRGRTNFYPLEICFVKDCQRAALNQLSARETSNMIRACAVAPNILQPQIEKTVGSLHLHDSPYLKEAHITLTKIPLKVDARRLPPPTIQYKSGNSAVEPDGKWQMRDAFLFPANCEKWAIYMIAGRNPGRFNVEHLRTFISMFIDMCRSCGMSMPVCADSNPIEGSAEAVEEAVFCCKKEKCDFVMFITEDVITALHNVIKSCEQKYEIVTQDLKMNNAFEIVTRGKKETLRNIVCKTNEKLGGLNYTITVEDEQVRAMITEGTLFIGLGISHPGPMSNQERARGATPSVPSVIGYAANMKKDPFDFIGDFAYDEPRRDEKFSTLTGIIGICVMRFKKHRGEFPTRLIVFRNGTSEGQFGMSLQYEVPLIRYALEERIGEGRCKLTLLVSQRAHNIRLFPEPLVLEGNRKPNYNIRPGTVVDQQLTHPEQSEFYLNSHVAIQGTARTPRYTVLLDESEFSMDVIESFTYALSYSHQIINSPTSLPSPIYIALLYAKRGRALFSVSRGKEERHNDGSLDYQSLTNRLCYNVTELAEQRVNA